MRHLTSLSILGLVLAGCMGTTPGGPSTVSTPTPAFTPPAGLAEGTRSAPPATQPPELDPWLTADLTDVRTGETFSIASLAGKVVVIEPMAIWCTNCLRQQREAGKALAALGSEDVVYISLDVDPSERAQDLAAYADERGFDWRFVVADRAMARSLARVLGDQVLSPPSTPKIIVTPEGEVVGPDFGHRSAEDLEAELRALIG